MLMCKEVGTKFRLNSGDAIISNILFILSFLFALSVSIYTNRKTRIFPKMAFREFTVKVPWGRLQARRWKLCHTEKCENRLVLLHGNSDHVGCWDWMVKHLPADWSVVAIDLPGHGRSELPQNYYSTMNDLFGYSVRYLVDELGWQNYHLGLSQFHSIILNHPIRTT